MTQYSTHKKLYNIPWYSPPFYTRAYKMCIRVDANGWGDGAGTHLSVHTYCMRCDILSKYKCYDYMITIQLVNHKNEQNQHEKTVHGSTYEYRKVTKDKTYLGYGNPQFITHADVESSSETRLHLFNDCLTWRVCRIDYCNFN